MWHQDEQYRHLPAHLTLLYCVHTPPDALGDTTFCDTVLGYEALPAELADRISGLTASHSLANIPLMNVSDGHRCVMLELRLWWPCSAFNLRLTRLACC